MKSLTSRGKKCEGKKVISAFWNCEQFFKPFIHELKILFMCAPDLSIERTLTEIKRNLERDRSFFSRSRLMVPNRPESRKFGCGTRSCLSWGEFLMKWGAPFPQNPIKVAFERNKYNIRLLENVTRLMLWPYWIIGTNLWPKIIVQSNVPGPTEMNTFFEISRRSIYGVWNHATSQCILNGPAHLKDE